MTDKIEWQSLSSMAPKNYVCSFCDHKVRVTAGYWSLKNGSVYNAHVLYVCSCGHPTYFYSEIQIPPPLPGRPVEHLPELVGKLFKEARGCLAAEATTACEMACRKILMNAAVARGADENKNFAFYVNWIEENGYIPPGCKSWLDEIRKAGNDANHEIPISTKESAQKTLTFTEAFLRFAFEFPGMAPTQSKDS